MNGYTLMSARIKGLEVLYSLLITGRKLTVFSGECVNKMEKFLAKINT